MPDNTITIVYLGGFMFETAQERVKLFKTGLSGKEIEMLYIEHNNFKIILTPILYEPASDPK